MNFKKLALIPVLPVLLTACGGSSDGPNGPALTEEQQIQAQLSTLIGSEIIETHPEGARVTSYSSSTGESYECHYKSYLKKKVVVGGASKQVLFWTTEDKKNLDSAKSDTRCKEEVTEKGVTYETEAQQTINVDMVRQSCEGNQNVTCEKISEVQVNGQTGIYILARMRNDEANETFTFESTAVPSQAFDIIDYSPYVNTTVTRENGEVINREYYTSTIDQRKDFKNSLELLTSKVLGKSLVEQGYWGETYAFSKNESGQIEAGTKYEGLNTTFTSENGEEIKCSYSSQKMLNSVFKYDNEEHMIVTLTNEEKLLLDETDDAFKEKCKSYFANRYSYTEILKFTFVTDKVVKIYSENNPDRVYDIK